MNTCFLAPTDLDQVDHVNKLRHFELDRRTFLKLFGGGLLVCMTGADAAAQESGRAGFGGHELPKNVSAWIHIGADNNVTVFTGKIECGQNVRTSLAQQVADELLVPFDSITMVMGDTDLTPWDAGTFGSQTTPRMGPQLRTMAATARQKLLDIASARMRCDPGLLAITNGRITGPNGRPSYTFGQLTHGEKLVATVSGSVPLMAPNDWKVAGTAVPKSNGRDFVTGRHKFPSDVSLPGMMFGKILRPEGFNAKLELIDTSGAEKVPGVKVVCDGDFVGVAGTDAWSAEQALALIKAKWKVPPEQPSNANVFEYLQANAEAAHADHGAPTIPDGGTTLERKYTVQYIAHAPLEPRAAVAQWENGKLTVWTGTQRPFGVKDELASAFHLSPDQVRVIQPDMGSGYGGKHTGEAAIEAARLAKAAGKPVRLVWTREEEFTWAYVRPAALMQLKAAVKPDGTLAYWEHTNLNAGAPGIATPYTVTNPLTRATGSKSPLRQGSYRGLASTANHFARESFMDELAHEIGIDPLAFRQKNLTNERILAVLKAATDNFGWPQAKSTPARGFGLACGTDKGGHVATCAEVAIDPATRKVRVVRVVQAWESGAIINPDGLRNQNVGAIIQGIGGAMFEAIRFEGGKLDNPHFQSYRVPRFADTPHIEVILIDRKDLPPAGAGEIGLVGIAPAIGNAIFAATGTRVRHMPLAPDDPVPGIDPSPFRA